MATSTGVCTPPEDGLFQTEHILHVIETGPLLAEPLAQLVDGGKLPRTVIYDKAREFNLINAELTDDDIDGLLDG